MNDNLVGGIAIFFFVVIVFFIFPPIIILFLIIYLIQNKKWEKYSTPVECKHCLKFAYKRMDRFKLIEAGRYNDAGVNYYKADNLNYDGEVRCKGCSFYYKNIINGQIA